MEEFAGGAMPFDNASAAVPELQRTVPFSNDKADYDVQVVMG